MFDDWGDESDGYEILRDLIYDIYPEHAEKIDFDEDSEYGELLCDFADKIGVALYQIKLEESAIEEAEDNIHEEQCKIYSLKNGFVKKTANYLSKVTGSRVLTPKELEIQQKNADNTFKELTGWENV